MKAAAETLDSIIVIKRRPRKYMHQQHLCHDKGYDFPEIEREVFKRRYVSHIRHRGERRKRERGATKEESDGSL
jgi:hypothetical protein